MQPRILLDAISEQNRRETEAAQLGAYLHEQIYSHPDSRPGKQCGPCLDLAKNIVAGAWRKVAA